MSGCISAAFEAAYLTHILTAKARQAEDMEKWHCKYHDSLRSEHAGEPLMLLKNVCYHITVTECNTFHKSRGARAKANESQLFTCLTRPQPLR